MRLPKKRGPRPGRRATAPLFPDRVRFIVEARDRGLKLEEVAIELERAGGPRLTKQAIFLQYHRWKEWARAQNAAPCP